MTSSHPRRPLLRASSAALTLVASLGLGVATAPGAAAQVPDAGDAVVRGPEAGAQVAESSAAAVPGLRKSANMSLVKNLPKNGAFFDETAFNSDLAFGGNYAYAGNYNGFTVYDVSQPRATRQVVQLVCPGSQNDISVQGRLLFLSVDSRRSDDTCNSLPATEEQSKSGEYWEGIRIFDISNPVRPRYLKSVETACGSHTHTLVPSANGQDIFVYVSSYGPSTEIAKCPPPHDKISIVKVPVAAPTEAAVVATPVLFPDGGLTETTAGCHDITAYPQVGLAAGACMGEGAILDIADPVAPQVVERVADKENFAFWHSATFSNAADKIVFTDELGGGGAPTCNRAVGQQKGADAIYRLGAQRQLTLASYYKIPRQQTATENCVAHNGSLIPVSGADVMVQAWYQGGISVFDFTDPRRPTEIGYYDRPALSTERTIIGGSWSAYYYRGFIFSNDIQKGLDVIEINDPRVASASDNLPGRLNPQSQQRYRG